MEKNELLLKEARVIGCYLTGIVPEPHLQQRYAEGCRKKGLVDPDERKLWKFTMNNPRALGLVDSGLALLRPHASVRNKLLLMTAVLEATPEYAHLFLPRKRSAAYLLNILFTGVWAGIKGLLGVLLVKSIGLR